MTLFKPQAGSPSTSLVNAITDTQTEIEVVDVTILPDPPNILTLTSNDNFETIIYNGIDEAGNLLQNITRGVEGTAQSWESGTTISRLFTAKDLLDLQAEITKLNNQMKDVDRTFYKVTAPAAATTLSEVETEIMSATTN